MSSQRGQGLQHSENQSPHTPVVQCCQLFCFHWLPRTGELMAAKTHVCPWLPPRFTLGPWSSKHTMTHSLYFLGSVGQGDGDSVGAPCYLLPVSQQPGSKMPPRDEALLPPDPRQGEVSVRVGLPGQQCLPHCHGREEPSNGRRGTSPRPGLGEAGVGGHACLTQEL